MSYSLKMEADKGLGRVGFAVFHLIFWGFLGFRILPAVSRIFAQMLDGASLPFLTLSLLRLGTVGCLIWGVIGSAAAFGISLARVSTLQRSAVVGLLWAVMIVAGLSLFVPLLRMGEGVPVGVTGTR